MLQQSPSTTHLSYLISECREPADVVIALDSSASIGASRYAGLLDLTKDIVNSINIGPSDDDSRIGLQTYASDSLVRYHMDKYTSRRDAVNAISFLYMDGSTETHNALSTMRSMYESRVGDRRAVKNVGILISDGHSNDRDRTQAEAQLTRSAGITLLSIGVGMKTHYDENEMRLIASADAAYNFIPLPGLPMANNISLRIVDAVCNSKFVENIIIIKESIMFEIHPLHGVRPNFKLFFRC